MSLSWVVAGVQFVHGAEGDVDMSELCATLYDAGYDYMLDPDHAPSHPQVRKTPSWPKTWANFSLLQLCSHWNVWANLHLLGQPNTFLAAGGHYRSLA